MGADPRLETVTLRALRLGIAGVLLALAVVAALLAADVRAWPAALERGDATYSVAPGQARWTPTTHLGSFAATLLGVSDDVAARVALRRFSQVAGLHQHLNDALDVQTERAGAINALDGPASSADPTLAAQARTLLGILTFSEAAQGGGISQTNAAIADFTDAVRVDPGNSAAKFDLELLLRLSAASGHRRGTGPVNAFGNTGHAGTSGGAPGSGY
jgi:hypothetical protein